MRGRPDRDRQQATPVLPLSVGKRVKNKSLPPIVPTEFDYTIDPDTGEPADGQLGCEGAALYKKVRIL